MEQMKDQTEKDQTEVESHVGPEAKLPPPFEGATRTIQSLGRWVDDLLGDRRARKAAGRALAAIGYVDEIHDPPPSEPPPPVPGGTGYI